MMAGGIQGGTVYIGRVNPLLRRMARRPASNQAAPILLGQQRHATGSEGASF